MFFFNRRKIFYLRVTDPEMKKIQKIGKKFIFMYIIPENRMLLN
jgi:hypothetical protein